MSMYHITGLERPIIIIKIVYMNLTAASSEYVLHRTDFKYSKQAKTEKETFSYIRFQDLPFDSTFLATKTDYFDSSSRLAQLLFRMVYNYTDMDSRGMW